MEASILQSASEQLATSDSENEEEEHQYQDRVSQERHGIDKWRHDNSQTLNTGNCSQGTDNSERSQHTEVGAAPLHKHAHVAWSNNGEVEYVPSIAKIGTLIQDETHRHYLEDHFNCVHVLEDVVCNCHKNRCLRGVSEGVIHSKEQRVNNDNGYRYRFE